MELTGSIAAEQPGIQVIAEKTEVAANKKTEVF